MIKTETVLSQEVKSFWLSALETKFVLLNGDTEFSIFLMAHILKKEYNKTINLEITGFIPTEPLLIAFSAGE